MVNDWKEVKLQDVVSILGDGLHGTPKYSVDGEYYFINGSNLDNGKIVFSDTTKKVDHEQYLKYKKDLNDRTLLVSINGTIGNVAYYNGERVVLGKSACYFNLHEGIEKRYVRYVLSSHYFTSYLYSFATGTTIKNVSLKSMREFNFKLPPISEQKAIAHILGTLDDKIELNRQMNETLEAMAQALFKSWFVDFDPVIDNALLAGKTIPEPLKERAEMRQAQLDSGKAKTNSEINDLFPSEFEFTEELGWIPRGWSIANFGDLLKSTIGGDWGKPEPDEKHTIPSVIIRGTDIPDLKTGNRSAAPKRWVEAKKLKTRKLEPYDIVIEISGGSPTQSTGRSIIINENLLERLGGTVEPASFCRRFTPIDKYIGVYAGIHLQKIYDDGKMWEYQNQSTGIANFQTTSFLEREILVLPNKELIVKYYELVNPLINKMTSNQQIELAKLRDTLLPKLMSGELRIPDAEKLAENI